MLRSVQKLHRSGIRVSGGFIVGFDQDPEDIFEQQANFIRKSGIVTAMVGLLNAPAGTSLFKRLKNERRLLSHFLGDNMDGSINFIPKMPYQKLISGYKELLDTIYAPKEYYERLKIFLREYKPQTNGKLKISLDEIKALVKSFWYLGLIGRGKRYYWELLFSSIFKYPRSFPIAVTLAIHGFHFRQIAKSI
jgi:radical SAM superfamily enzyme YgiQ (UPF0313 family)